MSSGLHRLPRVAVEFFSGSGKWSSAMRRRGYVAIEVDVIHGPQSDVTNPYLVKLFFQLLNSGVLWAVHLGTPCCTFSRARGRGNGPGALRSTECPRGLDKPLSVADSDKVKIGNQLADFSARAFERCRLRRVPCSLENPHTSILWYLPEFVQLAARNHVRTDYTDFCMDGKPWRKVARLMVAHIDLARVTRQCKSCDGICCRTHRVHQTLEGKNDQGIF